MQAALTKMTQWVRSRDGSGTLRRIWSGTPTSWHIWEVEYARSYYLWPRSVDHFCIQPEWLQGKGRPPGITAQSKSPTAVSLPLHPWLGRTTPEGTACDCPGAGVIHLADLYPSLCQHVILHQQGINPASSACSTTASCCCCCCSWLYG